MREQEENYQSPGREAARAPSVELNLIGRAIENGADQEQGESYGKSAVKREYILLSWLNYIIIHLSYVTVDLEGHVRDLESTRDLEQEAVPDDHEREVNRDRVVEVSVDPDHFRPLGLEALDHVHV